MTRSLNLRRALLAATTLATAAAGSILYVAVAVAAAKTETLRGQLEVVAECDGEASRTLYFLNTGSERIQINLKNSPDQELTSGMNVSVTGSRKGDAFAADPGSFVSNSGANFAASQNTSSLLPNTFGERKLLVMLVNFTDNTTQPFTAAQANGLILDQTNASSVTNFYRENSYGQTWITGDVVNWSTLPIASGDCGGSKIAQYGKQAAAAAGYNLSAYTNYMYIFPTMSQCSYGGTSTIGGNQTWINGYLYLGTIAHELGHNFGLYHARAMDCGAAVIDGTCSTIEYGSIVDTMGKPGVTGNFEVYDKERLGWINYGSSPTSQVVSTSGSYNLEPLSTLGAGTKGLKIYKGLDSSGVRTWYYIELRRPIGFDKFVSSNASLMNSVVVSLIKETNGQDNYLLDMTPATSSWDDAGLAVSRSYTDSALGMTITPVSVADSGAVVNIDFGSAPPPTCTLADPSVSVSPIAAQSAMAGATLNYSVTVTNNNSAGCTGSGFDLGIAVPANWVSTGARTLSVAPGGSVTTPISVTVPAGTADGSYSGSVSVAVSGGPPATTSSLGFSVYSNLTVSAAPGQSAYTKGQTAVVTANVSSGSGPCAGASVSFTMTKPNGSKVTASATTDSAGSAVFSYRTSKKDASGVYAVSANASRNGGTGSASTSFSLQ